MGRKRGHESIFCDGRCQEWVHRQCAGLSKVAFQAVSKSNDDFRCPHCVITQQAKDISALSATVSVLSRDVKVLQDKLAEITSNGLQNVKPTSESEIASLRAEVASLRATLSSKEVSLSTKQTGSQKPSRMGASWSARTDVSNKQPRGPKSKTLRSSSTTTTSTLTGSQVHTTEIIGARKIWGTIKTATSFAVSTTLKRLTTIGSKLIVKRKFQAASESGHKERWWFIIRGEEADLTCLQSQWEAVANQTAGKLESVAYTPSPPTSSSPNTTLVSSPAVPTAESITDPTVSIAGADNTNVPCVPVSPVSPSPEPDDDKPSHD